MSIIVLCVPILVCFNNTWYLLDFCDKMILFKLIQKHNKAKSMYSEPYTFAVTKSY